MWTPAKSQAAPMTRAVSAPWPDPPMPITFLTLLHQPRLHSAGHHLHGHLGPLAEASEGGLLNFDQTSGFSPLSARREA